ncbi:SurA N-terminal domain-containing protein [Thermovibrio sp.]
MLAKIRKNLRAFSLPLWIVAASFIGTIFFVWGKGSFSGPSAGEVATVNGEGIPLSEFNREYQNTVNILRKRFGENFRKFVSEKQIKELTLNRLITRYLLLELAKEEGLKVSDWAVAKYIEEIPAFQEKGKFSIELYNRFLQANHLTPQTFEDTVRKDLLIRKVLEVVNRAPSVSNFEVRELYKKVFGKRKFRYKLFLINQFNPQVSEKEIEEFYRKNKEMFKTKEEEKFFVVKLPNDQKGQKKAEELYKLAKEGKFKELLKEGATEIKDQNLIKELKGKPFVFKSEGKELLIAFKVKEGSYKSLNEVKGEIEKIIKRQKALALAKKAALEFKGQPEKETKEIDAAEFVKEFKVNPLENPQKLFTAEVGQKVVVSLINGYGVFVPVSKPQVEKMEKDKEERIREFILKAKRESDYQNLLNLLRNRATIKVNPSLFRS